MTDPLAIPTSPRHITPEWLTAALRRGGHFDAGADKLTDGYVAAAFDHGAALL